MILSHLGSKSPLQTTPRSPLTTTQVKQESDSATGMPGTPGTGNGSNVTISHSTLESMLSHGQQHPHLGQSSHIVNHSGLSSSAQQSAHTAEHMRLGHAATSSASGT